MRFLNILDKLWNIAGSVKVTIFLLIALALLSIPGMLILQQNISNVDPAIQYDYNFWYWGKKLQLFTSYQSFWYVGLIIILAMNLIICSYERYPQMWKLATAKPVAWAKETFLRQPKPFLKKWQSSLSADQFESQLRAWLKKKAPFVKIHKTIDSEKEQQFFWQTGRWSRIANYLVHASLLMVFLGAIVTSLKGFEGAANIPEFQAVKSLLMFKEGPYSRLKPVPKGGMPNEKLFNNFSVYNDNFEVEFYDDFPSRPKEFSSYLKIVRDGEVVKEGLIEVNEPMTFENFTFYQASYGQLNDALVQLLVIDKKKYANQEPMAFETRLGEPVPLTDYGLEILVLQAREDLYKLGPAVQLQEVKNGQAFNEPFWVLQNNRMLDFEKRNAKYGVILNKVEPIYYTGLQIGYDPGAPIYWLGCIGMILGTLYALFITHKKYYISFKDGEVLMSATIHRLPMGFENYFQKISKLLEGATKS